MIPRFKVCLFLIAGALATLRAGSAPAAGPWDTVTVAPMRTSIYVGSVLLTTSKLSGSSGIFSATYDAKVRPWFFWNETGTITINLSTSELARLHKGERLPFTGNAANEHNKPRTITGYAEVSDNRSGKIKVRILADGTELIFNGTYRFE